jgi:hypothetical protein
MIATDCSESDESGHFSALQTPFWSSNRSAYWKEQIKS